MRLDAECEIPSLMIDDSAAVIAALRVEVSAGGMTVHEALTRAFMCGLNAAVHAQQDREAAESGAFLAAVARRAG